MSVSALQVSSSVSKFDISDIVWYLCLSDLLHFSAKISDPSMLLQMALFHPFFYGWTFYSTVYTLSIHLLMDNCQYCCYEHWSAKIFWIIIFSRYMPRKWDFWIICLILFLVQSSSCFNSSCSKPILINSVGGLPLLHPLQNLLFVDFLFLCFLATCFVSLLFGLRGMRNFCDQGSARVSAVQNLAGKSVGSF